MKIVHNREKGCFWPMKRGQNRYFWHQLLVLLVLVNPAHWDVQISTTSTKRVQINFTSGACGGLGTAAGFSVSTTIAIIHYAIIIMLYY